MKAKFTKNRQRVIETCYAADPELIEKYHIMAPTNVKNAVRHTLSVFLKSDKFKMYELIEKGNFVGYIGVEETDIKYIQGFFIMPQYRNKEIFDKFFEIISHVVGDGAYIPVYEKNERAILFLERNKCRFVRTVLDKETNSTYKIFQLT